MCIRKLKVGAHGEHDVIGGVVGRLLIDVLDERINTLILVVIIQTRVILQRQ